MNYGWLKPPIPWKRGPLITPDANTVAHVYWRNGALVDSKGNTWAMQGTVPQVAASGKIPPGAGPFTDANYYILGAGADVLDFAGAFTLVLVMKTTAATSQVAFSNRIAGGAGYYARSNDGLGTAGLVSPAGYVSTAVPALGSIFVLCAGYSGTQTIVQVNGTPQAPVTNAAPGSGATAAARIGRYVADGFAATSTVIYEGYWTSTPASQALFASIAASLSAKMGLGF